MDATNHDAIHLLCNTFHDELEPTSRLRTQDLQLDSDMFRMDKHMQQKILITLNQLKSFSCSTFIMAAGKGVEPSPLQGHGFQDRLSTTDATRLIRI